MAEQHGGRIVMAAARIMVTQKLVEQIESDLLVYFLAQDGTRCPQCSAPIKELVENAWKLKDFSGKAGEQILVYPSSVKGRILAKRVLVIGLGKITADAGESNVAEKLRKAGGNVANVCAKIKASSLAVSFVSLPGLSAAKAVQYLSEGILLGDYRFDKYKGTTQKKDDYKGLKSIRVSCSSSVKAVRSGVKQALTAANAACKARDMANEPGNGWTSKEFAKYAKDLADKYDLTYTCLEKKDMEKLGMGGILAVNQGSAIPPRMVALE